MEQRQRWAAPTPGAPAEFGGVQIWLVRRLVRLLASGERWLALPAVAVALALTSLVILSAGGTKTATPHLYYIAIIVAAVSYGIGGAVTTAVIAALLCGQLPVDTFTGERQPVTTVVLRAFMFVVVAVVVSGALALRRRLDRERYYHELKDLVSSEVPTAVDDPSLEPLVAEVLERGAFRCVYQPVYSMHTGELLAVEALTRFDVEPYRSPDRWFAAAARMGLGPDLELAAIGTALAGATGLPPGVRLCVNASPDTIADPRLLELVGANIGTAFTVELTEHAVITDYDLIAGPLAALRSAGALIAVDDTGAGFSSLRHIVQVQPDIIKLDISLTQQVSTSPARRALGGALVEFVQRTGAMLVLEGIETHGDLEVWTDMGADAVQGYLVGRPGPLPVATRSARVHALCERRSAAQSRLPDPGGLGTGPRDGILVVGPVATRP